jgi:hypothetical protein
MAGWTFSHPRQLAPKSSTAGVIIVYLYAEWVNRTELPSEFLGVDLVMCELGLSNESAIDERK